MAKSLNDILKSYSDALAGKKSSETVELTTGKHPGVDYADKMKDTRDFIAQHSVEKFDDRVGNTDDVYQAANVKTAEMKRHGHEPKPKDIKVYKKNQQVGQPENVKEESEVDEAKMCESCGKSSCECGSNKEPRYNGKDTSGKRKLLTDKKLQEKLTKDMSAGEVIKDFEKSDDPRFKGDSKEKRKERALAAWYKLKKEDVNESISDQRSSKGTASEKAREKIFAAIEKRKEKILDKKLEAKTKMKEQAAPVETPITFPATNSREGSIV